MHSSANTPSAGRKLGQYVLMEEIGRGGMGLVYKALDTALERTIALKIMPTSAVDDPTQAERFIREARSLARLSHPNLLHVYNVGSEADCSYFAMELLEGESLSALIARRIRIPADELIQYIGQIVSALAYVHRQGITHRDIKSSNIMICGHRAVLMDFGLAKDAQYAGLTSAGAVLGTPEYMAPEAADGRLAGPATDIYGLGVVMFEGLSGTLPFTGRSAMSIMRQQIEKPPPALTNLRADIDPALAAIVHKCLAKKPDERYVDCPSLAADLVNIVATPELLALVNVGGATVEGVRGSGGDKAPSRQVKANASAALTAMDATVVLPAAKVDALIENGFTSANTVVQPAVPPRTTWLWAAVGFFGVILLAAIIWRVRHPQETAPLPWQGQMVSQHKAGSSESQEFRWIEFNANDPDPEKWYHIVDRKQSDGTWLREKISHRDFVAGSGDTLEFKATGAAK